MPEPWIKLKLGTRRSDKLGQLSSDSARLGYVYALLEAKVQRHMGTFVNRAAFADVLGKYGRYLSEYTSAGLIHIGPVSCVDCARRHPDVKAGTVVVHDFLKEQRDPTNGDRQEAWRNAHENGADNGGETGFRNASSAPGRAYAGDDRDRDGDSSSSVRTPESRAAKPRPPSPAQKVKAWLKDHDLAQPVGWEMSKVNELARTFGPDAVIATFEEARRERHAVTTRNYVRWAEQSLAPDQAPQRPNGHARTPEPKGLRPSTEERDRAFVRE